MAKGAAKTNPRPSANPTHSQTSRMSAAIGRRSREQAHFQGYRLVRRRRDRHPTTLATTKNGLIKRVATFGSASQNYHTIPKRTAQGAARRSTFLRLYLHCLEHRQTQQSLEDGNGRKGLRRLVTTVGAQGGLCISASEAYIKGQTQREGLPQGSKGPESAKKGALVPDADYELWYQDESEFHLHPHLTRAWMPVGRQKRVPSPGKNRKQTVFGAFCYGRGLFYHHIQPRKTAWGVRVLLQSLVRRARRTGRRIILVMDQGNPHHARVLQRHLEDVRQYITVFWLPCYSPELNLIERLWKHLKGSRMANVLFSSFKQFTEHLSEGLRAFTANPDFAFTVAGAHRCQTSRKKLVGVT
jgi:transposase